MITYTVPQQIDRLRKAFASREPIEYDHDARRVELTYPSITFILYRVGKWSYLVAGMTHKLNED